MEPQIRYARTSDGVKIAYCVIGSGSPYIWPASPPSMGVVYQWRIPEFREVVEGIARRVTLIMYDPRGGGLSDRGPVDYSVEAMVRDLEAVADAAAPEPFTLQTFAHMSIPALAYAARHAERLTALVLLNGILRAADMSASWKRLAQLAADDWDVARALVMRTNEASYTSTATVEQTQEVFAREVSKEAFLAFSAALGSWDASDLVSRITTPALVVHYGQSTQVPLEACRRLAAALPNATFAPIELGSGGESRGDQAAHIVRGFLRGVVPPTERRSTLASPPAGTGTAVILFTDIADSTALTERMGDTAFRAASRALDTDLRTAIRDAGGTAIDGKLLGDGVLATFPSAAQAIDGARRCLALSAASELGLHIGLHAGDVIREDDNVYGGAVNIASRICGLCPPGEILVSATVRDLARTSAGVTFEDRGEQTLKGIDDPLRVFAVRPTSNI